MVRHTQKRGVERIIATMLFEDIQIINIVCVFFYHQNCSLFSVCQNNNTESTELIIFANCYLIICEVLFVLYFLSRFLVEHAFLGLCKLCWLQSVSHIAATEHKLKDNSGKSSYFSKTAQKQGMLFLHSCSSSVSGIYMYSKPYFKENWVNGLLR